MKKKKMINFSDDNIKEVMKGTILEPSSDFTAKLMNRVANVKAPVYNEYRPLISLRGWIIIGASVLILFVSCLMVLLRGGDYTNSTSYFDFLNPLFERAGNLNLSVNFESVLIGLMVFATIAILFFADFVFKTSIDPETGFQGN